MAGSLLNVTAAVRMDGYSVVTAVARSSRARLRVAAQIVERTAYNSIRPRGTRPSKGALPIPRSSPKGRPPAAHSGALKRAIGYGRADLNTYVIGPTRDVPYAGVHERGKLIPVTEKMRRFLHWAYGWRVGRWKAFIVIPPRPFMAPALLKSLSKIALVFANQNFKRYAPRGLRQ